MSAKTEKLLRIQKGERPYLVSGQLKFKTDAQVEFGSDTETGDLVFPLPTEDNMTLGLHGLERVLRWNTISKVDFQYLTTELIPLDELLEYIDQPPFDGMTSGEKAGGVVGAIHGFIAKYEAYVDTEGKASYYPLKLDNLPISEIVIPVAGQYVLFCIDEEVFCGGSMSLPDCTLDESKIQLYVERLRFGEIYFDMVGMKYGDQDVSDLRYHPPLTNGSKVFVCDGDGFIHQVIVST